MTAASVQHAPQHTQAPQRHRSALRRPGFVRAFAYLFLGVLFAAALVIALRALYHFPIARDGGLPPRPENCILLAPLLAAPLFWLVGLGAFDYWFYWASGKPTRPEDHSGHGAYSWRDYLRPNTDHKVIGIQYTVHSFVYLLIGGMFAMLMRAELAQPGMQF